MVPCQSRVFIKPHRAQWPVPLLGLLGVVGMLCLPGWGCGGEDGGAGGVGEREEEGSEGEGEGSEGEGEGSEGEGEGSEGEAEGGGEGEGEGGGEGEGHGTCEAAAGQPIELELDETFPCWSSWSFVGPAWVRGVWPRLLLELGEGVERGDPCAIGMLRLTYSLPGQARPPFASGEAVTLTASTRCIAECSHLTPSIQVAAADDVRGYQHLQFAGFPPLTGEVCATPDVGCGAISYPIGSLAFGDQQVKLRQGDHLLLDDERRRTELWVGQFYRFLTMNCEDVPGENLTYAALSTPAGVPAPVGEGPAEGSFGGDFCATFLTGDPADYPPVLADPADAEATFQRRRARLLRVHGQGLGRFTVERHAPGLAGSLVPAVADVTGPRLVNSPPYRAEEELQAFLDVWQPLFDPDRVRLVRVWTGCDAESCRLESVQDWCGLTQASWNADLGGRLAIAVDAVTGELRRVHSSLLPAVHLPAPTIAPEHLHDALQGTRFELPSDGADEPRVWVYGESSCVVGETPLQVRVEPEDGGTARVRLIYALTVQPDQCGGAVPSFTVQLDAVDGKVVHQEVVE